MSKCRKTQRIIELSAALTIVELRCAKLVSHPVVTADRRFFHKKITSSHLSTLDDSIWDILQELVYEGWRQPIEPNANLHKLETEISQK